MVGIFIIAMVMMGIQEMIISSVSFVSASATSLAVPIPTMTVVCQLPSEPPPPPLPQKDKWDTANLILTWATSGLSLVIQSLVLRYVSAGVIYLRERRDSRGDGDSRREGPMSS